MKKIKLLLGLIVFLGFSGLMIWKNHIPTSSIVGKYVNNNTGPVLEGPRPIQNGKDTLILFENGEFESKTWGKGTYEISSLSWYTNIKLVYNYELGKAEFSTYISKSYSGEIRICLNPDLGFYFHKID